MVEVGIAHHGILTHDIECLDLAVDGSVQDLHNGQARLLGEGSHSPGLGELIAVFRGNHGLVGREDVW